MSVLSDKQILEAIKRMDIVIFPYEESQLNSGSYNIKLGAYHYLALRDAFVPGAPDKKTIVSPSSQDVESSISGWSLGDPAEWRDKVVDIFPGPYGQDPTVEPLWSRCRVGDLILKPGDVALCHSEEFIGSLNGSITELRARSTLMRNCLALAPSAGWGDVNFVNRWAFTIHNYGHRTIRLHPGDEVGQIIFHSIGDVLKPYQGSYVQKANVAGSDYSEFTRKLVTKWDPIHLLSSVQREAQQMLVPPGTKRDISASLLEEFYGKSAQTEDVMLIEDGPPELDAVLVEEVPTIDERTFVNIDNDKILKAVKSRMLRSMNPKIDSRTNKRKAIQHTHILCDTLYTIIIQVYSRDHFDIVQEIKWRSELLVKIQEIVYEWTISKYEIELSELKRMYDEFRNSRDRSGTVDRNLEHSISQIYYEERDNYLSKLA